MASSAEIQTVLQEALRAQELEDDGDLGLAAEAYLRAACQLSYFVDLHVEKGTAAADFCQGLVQQYEQRITVLRSRQEAKGHQWLQLDPQSVQTRAALHADYVSSATPTSAAAFTNHRSSRGVLQEQMQLTQGPQQAVLAAEAAGAAGLQHVHDEPSSLAAGSSDQLDLLHTCQRLVSGSLDDVVGLEDVKLELEEAVFLPLQHPHLFKGMRQPARTFLLHGQPGTGKTLLVEKVAAEAGFMLLSVSPSMILSKWAGDSEKAISGVFDIARSFQPAIIFLDEVDSLGQSRGSNTDAGARRLLTELLIQFTRAAGDEGVYVFGATNRMQDCDPALLRRFSRRIEVPLPDNTGRKAFFESMLARPEIEADLSTADVSALVQSTEGYSGSDLADLCRTAALTPVRDMLRQRQQLQGNRKRRRLGLEALPSLAMGASQVMRLSDASCVLAAGSPTNSTGGTASAAEGRVGQEEGGDAAAAGQGTLQLRALTLADFHVALALVKPAAQDAQQQGA